MNSRIAVTSSNQSYNRRFKAYLWKKLHSRYCLNFDWVVELRPSHKYYGYDELGQRIYVADLCQEPGY